MFVKLDRSDGVKIIVHTQEVMDVREEISGSVCTLFYRGPGTDWVQVKGTRDEVLAKLNGEVVTL